MQIYTHYIVTSYVLGIKDFVRFMIISACTCRIDCLKDKIITLVNEGYTKSTYIINKIVHIYKSNLQCGLLT